MKLKKQIKTLILEHVWSHGYFRVREVQNMFGITCLEACKVVAEMIQSGEVEQVDLSRQQIYGDCYKVKGDKTVNHNSYS